MKGKIKIIERKGRKRSIGRKVMKMCGMGEIKKSIIGIVVDEGNEKFFKDKDGEIGKEKLKKIEKIDIENEDRKGMIEGNGRIGRVLKKVEIMKYVDNKEWERWKIEGDEIEIRVMKRIEKDIIEEKVKKEIEKILRWRRRRRKKKNRRKKK